jgi:hypothetical protein
MKILTLPIFILAFLLPMATGLIPQESWLWLYVSIPLALVASFLLICLPRIPPKKAGKLSPVENEEVFDHLFINKTQKTYITLRKGRSLKNN